MASENQNPNIVKAVHVRLSRGTTSRSTFVLVQSVHHGTERSRRTDHVPSSAKELASFGRTQPLGFPFPLTPSLILVTRLRMTFAIANSTSLSVD